MQYEPLEALFIYNVMQHNGDIINAEVHLKFDYIFYVT